MSPSLIDVPLEQCPKCAFALPTPDLSCPRCGIVFANWKAPLPRAWRGRYVYKMVQAAEHIVAAEETLKGNEAASYLEKLVNDHAAQGWEFYRIDEMLASVSSPALFGTRSQSTPIRFHIITFRKEAPSQAG
jgi:hypothetical protein